MTALHPHPLNPPALYPSDEHPPPSVSEACDEMNASPTEPEGFDANSEANVLPRSALGPGP
jgi:hypothetical protein